MKCIIDGCEKDGKWRCMCSAHYQRWRKSTTPEERQKLPKRKSPGFFRQGSEQRHADLVAAFGSVKRLCGIVGIDPVTLYRWPDGAIPKNRHAMIVFAAEKVGLNIDAVRDALVGLPDDEAEKARQEALVHIREKGKLDARRYRAAHKKASKSASGWTWGDAE